MEVAVLEGDDLLPTLDLLHRFGNRGLAIVGMDEVHEGPRQQLLFAVAENAVPRRIDALEVAIESRDAEHVQREHEETIELLLRAPPVDEQPDLVADAREHREQIRIGLADLAAEELHHAQHFAAQQDRESECRVQAFACRDVCARKVGVVHHVGDPDRPTAGPDTARQPHASNEGGCLTDGLELGKVG